jgi:hypothetical protein
MISQDWQDLSCKSFLNPEILSPFLLVYGPAFLLPRLKPTQQRCRVFDPF